MASLSTEQFPWTTGYGLPKGPLKSKGNTAEALKRTVARLGKHDWQEFDQHYTLWLWETVADLKIKWGSSKSK